MPIAEQSAAEESKITISQPKDKTPPDITQNSPTTPAVLPQESQTLEDVQKY
jgi:hypothetical protein